MREITGPEKGGCWGLLGAMLEPGVAWALRSCWEECDDKAGTLASLGGNPHSELRKPRKPYLSEPRFGPSSGCHIRGTTRAVDVPCPGTAAPPPRLPNSPPRPVACTAFQPTRPLTFSSVLLLLRLAPQAGSLWEDRSLWWSLLREALRERVLNE